MQGNGGRAHARACHAGDGDANLVDPAKIPGKRRDRVRVTIRSRPPRPTRRRTLGRGKNKRMAIEYPYAGNARRNAGHRGPANQRERLLVVDAGAVTRATLSDYLDRIGYRAHFASSGAEALAMLHGGLQTDAIVYDAAMPVIDGAAFVRQLHSEENLTPVLLMTAARGTEDKGADAPDAAIAKPFQLVDFGDTLLRMLAARVQSCAGFTVESR